MGRAKGIRNSWSFVSYAVYSNYLKKVVWACGSECANCTTTAAQLPCHDDVSALLARLSSLDVPAR